ncbi:MAG TPA: glutamine--fructose-6-phosphate transaminase (isomerizing) [Firmicutes bacterium]|nr:glutamine--fructose-6-phosphate transaminase (isomerizing) [Bacillota bacterium]
MCGIVGFIGCKPAAPLLLEGLAKLEYRGYDSAGIALVENERIDIYKAKGRLSVLSERLHGGRDIAATAGIGHTRWATHGKPSDENSHPHKSASGRFAVVHNGIIENYAVLKKQLQSEGVEFLSETDTEVIAHLIERSYTGDFLAAVRAAVRKLEGSYALGVLCAEHPDEFIAVRNASPLIVGLSDIGNFIASDIPAVLAHTRRVLQLADHELVRLTRDSAEVFDQTGRPVEKQAITVDWDVTSAEKGGYDHFMIKEILEQPQALSATISPRIDADGGIVLDGIHLTAAQLRKINRLFIVACGSAYHAGVVGKYVIEKLARVPVEVDLASEFRYRDPIVDEKSLVIIISQSGETADTLAALREAKRRGARVLSVVNVVGSTIASESDDVLYTWAGPEISVATTKAYSTQLTMLYLIAFYIAHKLGRIDERDLRRLLSALIRLPDMVSGILRQAGELKQLAQRYAYLEHAYFIGRNLDYAVSLEASLKLKEISYIHSEAYAAGELKHGTISLIEEGTFVVALACCEKLMEKTMSNIKEVKARGAEVLVLTTDDNRDVLPEADHVIYIPKTNDLLMPSLEVVPMQLLGYYIALARGCDIDKPRNLAKSVTVE